MNTVDISKKLTKEKPKIKISESKEYEMDNSLPTMLKMNSLLKKNDDIEIVEQAINIVLGKEAAEEIKKMSLPFNDYKTIFIAIMAGVNGEEFEEAEKRFNSPRK